MNFTSKSLANTLRETACQLFLSTLDKIDGAKDLVLSKSILIQLDAVCGIQKLRQNAVDKVFRFESGLVTSETRNRVYVIRPCVEEVRFVVDQISALLNQKDEKCEPIDVKFWIIFVPRFVNFCDAILEEEGVYEHVSILECNLGLLPLEYDVYSLEDETIYKTLFLNNNITPLSVIVDSIVQLQLLSGNIFEVQGQGRFAKMIADKLDQTNLINGIKSDELLHDSDSKTFKDFENLRFTEKKLDEEDKRSSFTDLYLIDRDCDYASILLSQTNYEGFIDERFNLCCNKFEFLMTSEKQEKKLIKHSLSSETDPIYLDIRDNHFSIAISLLKTKNRESNEKYRKCKEMDLSKLKNFVAHDLNRLKAEITSLSVHISAGEKMFKDMNEYRFNEQLKIERDILDGAEVSETLNYITELISHKLHPQVPLRLLSLLSLTQGGLRPRDYKEFHSNYCASFGLANNATFSNLKKVGILTEMNLSIGAMLNYRSNKDTRNSNKLKNSSPSPLSSFAGAMSNLTERASGRVAAVVPSSVLPRRGILTAMIDKFQLTPETAIYKFSEPEDPAFVFNGNYIPLICRLIDFCVLGASQQQKKNLLFNMTPNELAKLLPGSNFRRRQAFFDDLPANPNHRSPNSERSILIYFIGGVTFAEITALRFLAKQRNTKIAIATTSILNGNKLIDCMRPKQGNNTVEI